MELAHRSDRIFQFCSRRMLESRRLVLLSWIAEIYIAQQAADLVERDSARVTRHVSPSIHRHPRKIRRTLLGLLRAGWNKLVRLGFCCEVGKSITEPALVRQCTRPKDAENSQKSITCLKASKSGIDMIGTDRKAEGTC